MHNSMSSILVIFIATITIVMGQFQNGRTLDLPDPGLCERRIIHERTPDSKGYFFSWRDNDLKGIEMDWLGARNFCRKRCMDSVSLETSPENEWIKQRIVSANIKYIWTSGRVCDFTGCDRPDLQPIAENGWFWTAVLQKLAPSTNRLQNDWSENGGIGLPQPDNREIKQGGASENCVAVLNNFYKDGVHWHDVACHHKKSFVCEDNEELLQYAKSLNPNIRY